MKLAHKKLESHKKSDKKNKKSDRKDKTKIYIVLSYIYTKIKKQIKKGQPPELIELKYKLAQKLGAIKTTLNFFHKESSGEEFRDYFKSNFSFELSNEEEFEEFKKQFELSFY